MQISNQAPFRNSRTASYKSRRNSSSIYAPFGVDFARRNAPLRVAAKRYRKNFFLKTTYTTRRCSACNRSTRKFTAVGAMRL